MPDGSTKKYRRRFISKCNVILLKKPTSSSTNQKTPVEMTSSVVVNDDSGEKYEEVDLEDNNEPYNPEVRRSCLVLKLVAVTFSMKYEHL